MREIKFRAILHKEAQTRGEKEYAELHRYFTLEDIMRGKLVFAYPEHWQFSEFTGLKDKNGKEIYEGDIVKLEGIHINGKNKEVSFNGGAFGINGNSFDYGFDELNWGNLEIIGNIYENKELLK